MDEGRDTKEKRSAQAVRAFLLRLLGSVVGAALSTWWNDRHSL